MNDKELAERCEAFGAEDCGDYRWLDAGVIDSLPVYEFVRDWRVAGALMEKCFQAKLNGTLQDDTWMHSEEDDLIECMPRAIIEACVEALT